jgi:hypothetical protein
MGDSARSRDAIAKRSRAPTQLNRNPDPMGAIQVQSAVMRCLPEAGWTEAKGFEGL